MILALFFLLAEDQIPVVPISLADRLLAFAPAVGGGAVAASRFGWPCVRCAFALRIRAALVVAGHLSPLVMLSWRRSNRTGRRRRCCEDRSGCSRRPLRATDATHSTTWRPR